MPYDLLLDYVAEMDAVNAGEQFRMAHASLIGHSAAYKDANKEMQDLARRANGGRVVQQRRYTPFNIFAQQMGIRPTRVAIPKQEEPVG